MSISDFRISALTREHDRENFDCGEASLNDFIKKFARQNVERGLGRTFVATHDETPLNISGYYTLSSGAVDVEKIGKKLPRYPVPVVHLGRLAIDKTEQGKGLGNILLFDAFRRCLRVADEIGIYAIEVFALNESAKNFYLHYDFAELKDDKFHLYLPIKKVRKLFE
jgi:GNAT superfamily N-acetyltransferase